MSKVIPTHLAIICDGNRRWARDHKLQVFKGHEKAVNEVFEPLIAAAIERGIKYLTFWIFSTENWDRDKFEIEMLMNLFRSFFTRQIDELHEKGVRVNMIGRLTDFPEDIQRKIKEGMEKTRNNKKITVTLAMPRRARAPTTKTSVGSAAPSPRSTSSRSST
jgi:undecaprenyl diphosphate synthase